MTGVGANLVNEGAANLITESSFLVTILAVVALVVVVVVISDFVTLSLCGIRVGTRNDWDENEADIFAVGNDGVAVNAFFDINDILEDGKFNNNGSEIKLEDIFADVLSDIEGNFEEDKTKEDKLVGDDCEEGTLETSTLEDRVKSLFNFFVIIIAGLLV